MSQEFLYIVTIVFFFLSFLGMVLTGKLPICKFSTTDILAAAMVMVWIYGIIVGLAKGNNRTYIFRNFAGLILYISMFFLRRGKLKYGKLRKWILLISELQLVLIPVSYIMINHGGASVFYNFLVPMGMGTNMDTDGSISIWANNPNLVFVCYCFFIYKCLYEKKRIMQYAFLSLLCAMVILLCARSGGIILEFLALTALMIWAFVWKKAKKWAIILSGFLIVIGVFALYKPLSILFDVKDDTNNQTRIVQIRYIFSHFSLIGHGLGAEYKEIGKDYGIEVIYLDLLYKFGVFAFIILGIYVHTVLKAIKRLKSVNSNAYDTIPLALMGFLFVAAGNPILFAGPSVISHILAMLLIEDRENTIKTARNDPFASIFNGWDRSSLTEQ